LSDEFSHELYHSKLRFNRRYLEQSAEFIRQYNKRINQLGSLIVVADTVDLNSILDGYVVTAARAVNVNNVPADLALRHSDKPVGRVGLYNICVVGSLEGSIEDFAKRDASGSRRYLVRDDEGLSLFDKVDDEGVLRLVRSDYVVTSYDRLRKEGCAGDLFIEEFLSFFDLLECRD